MNGKKIKIAHVHVWDKQNKGNVAIVKSVQNLLRENLRCGMEIEDFPVEILQYLNATNLERLNSCDLVVVGGGGIYYKYFLPFDMENIRKIQPPVVIFGVGYIREIGSEEMNEAEKKSLYELNAAAALSSVRDTQTKELLKESGIADGKVEVIGDPAIFLPAFKTDKAALEPGRINIGINLNYSGWLGFGKYEDLILSSYREIALYFQKSAGAQIFYLKHHPDENNIIPKLGIENMKIVDLEPEEQIYFYSRLDMILGMMLHSAVMSFGAQTPFLNLGYDLRNKSFSEFIGFPELAIGADELAQGALAERMLEIFEKRQYYKDKFILRKEEILKSQTDFLAKVEKIIGKKYGE